jgi:5'-methylthioadenosine phosphorylase
MITIQVHIMKIGLISGTIPLKVDILKEITVETPYGSPSSPLYFFELNRNKYIYINRHGPKHTIPPHMINHRANVYALKQAGVEKIIGIGSTGIINRKIRPGSIAIAKDFIDFSPRLTYYNGPETIHVSMSDPICPQMKKTLKQTIEKLGIEYQEAVLVKTAGPSFETPAEISAYSKLDADLVGMTIPPEAVLSRELGICYAAILTADNLACGIGKSLELPDILKIIEKSGKLVAKLLHGLNYSEKVCSCEKAPEIGKF